MKIMRRNNSETWSLRGFVPVKFRSVEPRREIWISLRTDSRSVAEKVAQKEWDNQIEIWEARLRGDSSDGLCCAIPATYGFMFVSQRVRLAP